MTMLPGMCSSYKGKVNKSKAAQGLHSSVCLPQVELCCRQPGAPLQLLWLMCHRNLAVVQSQAQVDNLDK